METILNVDCNSIPPNAKSLKESYIKSKWKVRHVKDNHRHARNLEALVAITLIKIYGGDMEEKV